MKPIQLTEIATYYNTEDLLREVDNDKVAEYAEKLAANVDMGHLILGTYKEDGKVKRIMVDGTHRYWAIVAVNNQKEVKKKFQEFPAELRDYKTKSDALLDQLKVNEEHGLGVTVSDRDSQIRKVVSLKDYTMRQIAERFHLSHASIVRINKGTQKAGRKGGPKRGTKKGRGEVKALAPAKFMRNLKECYATMRNSPKRAEVTTYLWPESKKGEWQDERVADVKLIRDLVNSLSKFAEEMLANIEEAKEDRTSKKEKSA